MSTANVRPEVFREEHARGAVAPLITGWESHYAGYSVWEYWYVNPTTPYKVECTEADTDYTIYFSVNFMHQWISFELKHMDSAVAESNIAFTYTLEHTLTQNHPWLHMRGDTVLTHSVVETFEYTIYPPQTYAFIFSAATAGDFIEPRFTLMERF